MNAFKDAGVKLTESQKKDIDGFVLALESTIENTKQATIKATAVKIKSAAKTKIPNSIFKKLKI